MIKVSVIITVYNVEKYIKKCLLSVLNQTLKEIQVIIVDDGSTDSSSDIISGISDERVEYFYKKNGGLSSARNFGLQFVKGKYLIYLDGDDYIESDMYEKMYLIAENDESDLVECEYFKDYERYVITKKHGKASWDKIKFHPAYSWNKMIKSEVLINSDVRFINKLLYEDFYFNIELSSIIKKTSYLEAPFYHYVQHDSSIMHTINDGVFDIYDGISHILEFYRRKGLYEEYYQDLEYLIVRELLLSSSGRFFLYDKKNNTHECRKNYFYCLNLFPKWKKNKYLKKKSFVNLLLRTMNFVSYFLIIFLINISKNKR